MKRISYPSVIILLFSILLIREGAKVFFSRYVGCNYGKNIVIDSRFYTSLSLICPSLISYYFLLGMYFSILVTIACVFNYLGDKRLFILLFILSFILLSIDIIGHYYTISYILLLPFSFLFFSIAWIINYE